MHSITVILIRTAEWPSRPVRPHPERTGLRLQCAVDSRRRQLRRLPIRIARYRQRRSDEARSGCVQLYGRRSARSQGARRVYRVPQRQPAAGRRSRSGESAVPGRAAGQHLQHDADISRLTLRQRFRLPEPGLSRLRANRIRRIARGLPICSRWQRQWTRVLGLLADASLDELAQTVTHAVACGTADSDAIALLLRQRRAKPSAALDRSRLPDIAQVRR